MSRHKMSMSTLLHLLRFYIKSHIVSWTATNTNDTIKTLLCHDSTSTPGHSRAISTYTIDNMLKRLFTSRTNVDITVIHIKGYAHKHDYAYKHSRQTWLTSAISDITRSEVYVSHCLSYYHTCISEFCRCLFFFKQISDILDFVPGFCLNFSVNYEISVAVPLLNKIK